MKISDILGLNARSQLYTYKFNKPGHKKIANSKLLTKKYLQHAGVTVPAIYAKYKNANKAITFDYSKLSDSFALKPSRGLGGEGIVVVKKRAEENPSDGGAWITTQRTKVTSEDLKLHILDILEGAYSLDGEPDIAYIEEYVGRHKAFRKYAYRGTPDIRVIVFNKVPVMAMLRLPTKESAGRANLHQGAIGVGIDMATGITTRAYWHGDFIHFKPGTKRKLHGIKIPHWTAILETAVSAGLAAGLGYYGADVVLHPDKGPMILELNYQPGLSIQLANAAGLKKRLERVEDLQVRDAAHGVKIAKALFISNFSDRVKAEEGVKILSSLEEVKIKGKNGQRVRVIAKLDTGAWRTSISRDVADKLGLLDIENVLWSKKFKSALGEEQRPVINLVLWLSGRKIVTPASVAKRMSLKYPLIIGRKNLKGFFIDPDIREKEKELKNKK